MRIHIKYGAIEEYSSIKEEENEEEEPLENENTTHKKLSICQTIIEDIKKLIIKNSENYDIE